MALHLTFQTNGKRVCYCLLDGERSIKKGEYVLPSDQQESGLLTFLEEELGKDRDPEHVSMAWVDSHTTLIPAQVFGESNPKAIASLCFGEITQESCVDYNRIAEHGIVNVYSMSDWIKRFFIKRYPRIILQHSGSHLIRKMLVNDAFKLKISLILAGDVCLLCMTNQNKLIHYSCIDYSVPEDLVYHTTFALKQQDLLEEKGRILVDAISRNDEQQIDRFMELVKGIKDLSNFACERIPDLLPKSQQLCV